MTRSKKVTLISIGLVVVAAVALAAMFFNNDVTGTVTGEDARLNVVVTSVQNGTENNSKCAWTKTADVPAKIRLDASKLPKDLQTRCRALVGITNNSNVDMAVQAFTLTTTAGTVDAGLAVGCGKVLAPGASANIEPVGLFSGVPVGASGTLTGVLKSVDSASYDSTQCKVVL